MFFGRSWLNLRAISSYLQQIYRCICMEFPFRFRTKTEAIINNCIRLHKHNHCQIEDECLSRGLRILVSCWWSLWAEQQVWFSFLERSSGWSIGRSSQRNFWSHKSESSVNTKTEAKNLLLHKSFRLKLWILTTHKRNYKTSESINWPNKLQQLSNWSYASFHSFPLLSVSALLFHFYFAAPQPVITRFLSSSVRASSVLIKLHRCCRVSPKIFFVLYATLIGLRVRQNSNYS
jgi:hypothetical protein